MRQLVSMRMIVDDPLSPAVDPALDYEPGFTAVTPHFPLLPPAPPSDELKLPLTKPMALCVVRLYPTSNVTHCTAASMH
jgi:hypothetical protein